MQRGNWEQSLSVNVAFGSCCCFADVFGRGHTTEFFLDVNVYKSLPKEYGPARAFISVSPEGSLCLKLL